MIELRPYQASGIASAREHILAGRKRIILCGPTGSGKSVVAASIIQSARTNFQARVLVVAHRRELIDQMVQHLARHGITETGVIMADDVRTNEMLPCQVASIQSLSRRSAPQADIVIIDECHRAAAVSYRKLIDLYPNAAIIGLTATPCRADGKPLGEVFQAIEVFATYEDAIRDKFIVAPRCFAPAKEVNLSDVRTVAGDYDIGGLETAMMDADVLGDTLEQYRLHHGGHRTVIFACTVAHSKAIQKAFQEAGINTAHIDAETPEDVRSDISRALNTREIDVVTNVGIYCEGWDEPPVKCSILARPTKSLTLFKQMAGRTLRPWNGMTPNTRSWLPEDGPSVQPILIDQGGNIDRLGWPHEDHVWSLDGRAKRKSEKKPTKCIQCRAYIPHYPCPECGFAPVAPPKEVRIDASVKLVERERVFNDPRRSFFEQQVESARGKGYKPGFAGAKYKEKYGEWPPWSWSQYAKDEFAHDEKWKRRHEQHEIFKARWNNNNSGSDEPVEYDSDESIGEWARGHR